MEGLSAPEPLNSSHSLEQFDSGSAPIDSWLKNHAFGAMASRTAKVFVVCKDNVVVAYFALAASRLRKEELPNNAQQGLSNHPVPTVLLARMGVDRSLQGQGIGTALVANAVSRSLAATENIAAFALIANAKPQSQSFYKRLGFLQSPKDPSLMILPLVID